MIHLRIVVPSDLSGRVTDLLRDADAVFDVVFLEGAAAKPEGDVVLADVAREDTSVILAALKELGVHERGTIALERIDSVISRAAEEAERAAPGLPSDAVVWEEVEARTSEETELGGNFLGFMTLATMIAAVGVMTDSPILIIGAMVVGPEFGPLAALCVAVVQRRRDLAARSLLALAVGFPVAMALTLAGVLILRGTGVAPHELDDVSRPLTQFISHPDGFSVVVAGLAGVAGILSLTSAKSGALVGVLISVTTIPAAGNIAAAAAYADWGECGRAAEQLFVNLALIVLTGVATLYCQRRLFLARQARHSGAGYRRKAGLPSPGGDRTGRR